MKASLIITGVGLGGFKGLGINIGSAAYFKSDRTLPSENMALLITYP